MKYWPFERWAKLWRVVVGWDRGMAIASLGDTWCVQIDGNRISRWF